MDERQMKRLAQAVGRPAESSVRASGRRVARWFERNAPLIQWDRIASPLGPLFIASSAHGLCSLDFGLQEKDFLDHLDPQARTVRNPIALQKTAEQLREYFAATRKQFDLPLDLRRLTPFQLSVLQTARRIPLGSIWTYGQMARAVGRPKASRAVGQALGSNPIPIVIPCHRVVGSDGSLRGYGGGGGLESKRLLLQLEGAIA